MKIEPMPHTSVSNVCISAITVVLANDIVQNPTVMLMSDFNEEAAIQLCQDNHILGVPIVDENHIVTVYLIYKVSKIFI